MVIRDVPVARCHPEVQSGHTRENFYPGGWVEMMGSNNYLISLGGPIMNQNASLDRFHFGWSIIMLSG